MSNLTYLAPQSTIPRGTARPVRYLFLRSRGRSAILLYNPTSRMNGTPLQERVLSVANPVQRPRKELFLGLRRPKHADLACPSPDYGNALWLSSVLHLPCLIGTDYSSFANKLLLVLAISILTLGRHRCTV